MVCKTALDSVQAVKEMMCTHVAPHIELLYFSIYTSFKNGCRFTAEDVGKLNDCLSSATTRIGQMVELANCATGPVDCDLTALFEFGVPNSTTWGHATILTILSSELMPHVIRLANACDALDKHLIVESIAFMARSFKKLRMAAGAINVGSVSSRAEVVVIKEWLADVSAAAVAARHID